MISKFNDLLHLRFRESSKQPSKMTALVELANSGELSSFSGVFRVLELNDQEKSILKALLNNYQSGAQCNIDADLASLIAITSEVKAIANQAVILQGERIKKAQDILKKYRDGAFTAWLYATYGNRQTPYNFLQYYELYTMMPPAIHPLIDQMPRQAVYILASRNGSLEQKAAIIKEYYSHTKKELLNLIRMELPLEPKDKRRQNFAMQAIDFLKKANETLSHHLCILNKKEKAELESLVSQLKLLLKR